MTTITVELLPPKKAVMRPRPGPQLAADRLMCVHLSGGERAAVDAAREHFGYPTRAAFYRAGIDVAIQALDAGGEIPTGHAPRPQVRTGEGVVVDYQQHAALIAATANAGVPISAAIRWGSLQIARNAQEALNGDH